MFLINFSFLLQNLQLPLDQQQQQTTAETLKLINKNFLELSHGGVTATPKPQTTELDDIFISVKTTKNYHDKRLALIIKTWFQLAKGQVSRLFL